MLIIYILVDCASWCFRVIVGTIWRRAYSVGDHSYSYQSCLVRICEIKYVSTKGLFVRCREQKIFRSLQLANSSVLRYWNSDLLTQDGFKCSGRIIFLPFSHQLVKDCFVFLLSLKDALVPKWKQSINSQCLPLKDLGGSFLKYWSSDTCIFLKARRSS